MIFLLSILCLLLLATTIISIYYTFRFARIILIIEDDLSETIDSLEKCKEVFERILGMKLFFDSPEIRPILSEAIEDIKICRFSVQKIITKFVEKSKQKYFEIDEDEDQTK